MSENSNLAEIEKRHKEILWTTVRVKAPSGKGSSVWGSGTLIYSESDKKGIYHTYVLTCHHVIEEGIKVEKKWDPSVGMDVKKETRTPAEVELFYYEHLSHAKGIAGSYRAFIRSYNADQDIALLELDRTTKIEEQHLAWLFPKDLIDKEIHVFDEIYACGAAMAHKPIGTKGTITYMDEIIEDYEYWMGNAPTIFGNSGGAIFRYSPQRNRYEFIGMPARITVNIRGFSADPITHMGYFVPINRIYNILEKDHYEFIYDATKTYEQCEEERKKAAKEARRLFMSKFGEVSETTLGPTKKGY